MQVRECGTGETDIDVAVEAAWWKVAHLLKLMRPDPLLVQLQYIASAPGDPLCQEGGNPGRVTAAMESAGLHSTTYRSFIPIPALLLLVAVASFQDLRPGGQVRI